MCIVVCKTLTKTLRSHKLNRRTVTWHTTSLRRRINVTAADSALQQRCVPSGLIIHSPHYFIMEVLKPLCSSSQIDCRYLENKVRALIYLHKSHGTSGFGGSTLLLIRLLVWISDLSVGFLYFSSFFIMIGIRSRAWFSSHTHTRRCTNYAWMWQTVARCQASVSCLLGYCVFVMEPALKIRHAKWKAVAACYASKQVLLFTFAPLFFNLQPSPPARWTDNSNILFIETHNILWITHIPGTRQWSWFNAVTRSCAQWVYARK